MFYPFAHILRIFRTCLFDSLFCATRTH
jgi:hypothetical protein